MANESVNVSGPVHVQSDCKERVALDLAQLIALHSGMDFNQKNETYWLTLYYKCWRATRGGTVT